MERKQEFTNQGRSGYILYKDAHCSLKLYYEFGGGNCVVIIHIPTIEEWVSVTSCHSSDRILVLSFIAEQAIKDQAPNCFYILSDRFIEIFNS